MVKKRQTRMVNVMQKHCGLIKKLLLVIQISRTFSSDSKGDLFRTSKKVREI